MQAVGLSMITQTISTLSTVTGFCIIAVSLTCMLYSLYNFRWRAAHIRNQGEVRYDDVFGPITLFILMTAAVIISAIFTVRSRLVTVSPGWSYDYNYHR